MDIKPVAKTIHRTLSCGCTIGIVYKLDDGGHAVGEPIYLNKCHCGRRKSPEFDINGQYIPGSEDMKR